MDTGPTSAEDTANESSDLPDLDTEDEEVLEEGGVTGEVEEEEEREKEWREAIGVERGRRHCREHGEATITVEFGEAVASHVERIAMVREQGSGPLAFTFRDPHPAPVAATRS